MTNFIQTAVTVGGIGGLGFAIFYLLCRDIIRKKIFPRFTKEQAYNVIRLIIILAFLVTISGLLAWIYKAPGLPVALVPKIGWVSQVKAGSNSGRWLMEVKDGPVNNLSVESVEYVAPYGSASLILQTASPLRAVSQSDDTSYYIDFTHVDDDLIAIAHLLENKKVHDIYNWMYYFHVKATYDSEVGTKFEKVWDFSFRVKDLKTNPSATSRPLSSTTSDYEYERTRFAKIEECGRTFAGPGLVAAMAFVPIPGAEGKVKGPDWDAVLADDSCLSL
jgi:hypothetical protein